MNVIDLMSTFPDVTDVLDTLEAQSDLNSLLDTETHGIPLIGTRPCKTFRGAVLKPTPVTLAMPNVLRGNGLHVFPKGDHASMCFRIAAPHSCIALRVSALRGVALSHYTGACWHR